MQLGTNGANLPSGVFIYIVLARVPLLSSFVILYIAAFHPRKGIVNIEVGGYSALEV